jgi:endo-1,4-beta-xylanase
MKFPVVFRLTLVTLFLASSSGCTKAEDPVPTVSLKEAAKGLFHVGVGIRADHFSSEEELSLLKREFDFVTPENCMKPAAVQNEKGICDFRQADRFVELAETNGLQVVGHCLVWAKDDRTPEWFFKDGAGKASTKLLIRRMKSHMACVQGRYNGRINHWDVVNELLADGDATWRESGWYSTCELEFAAEAFRTARQLDPDGFLVYNDYRAERKGKRESLFELIEYFKANDVPIDAIGLQGHYELDDVPYEDLDFTIGKIRDYGLKVVISEVDIDVVKRGRWYQDDGAHREELKSYDPYEAGCPEEVLQQQAEQYAKLFEVYAKNADVIERVSFWNLHDGQSWLNYFPWKRANHPLLFDRELKRKPAHAAVIEVLERYRNK